MSITASQTLHKELDKQLLVALHLAVQIERKRYKDIPSDDLTIEVRTLFRAQERLALIVHGLSEGEYLLLHEWEAVVIAARHEIVRYDQWPDGLTPNWVQELRLAVHKVMKMIKEVIE
jgi:hypothetical protein